jgi:uncharacterized membrane protein YesL
MGLFDRLYAPDRPELRKDAPKRTGLALFAEIVAREWWELLKLNLLFAVVSLAVVTIPAALAGATRVVLAMIEDRNTYLGRDFFETFRVDFTRASLGGWLLIAGQAIAAYAVYIYAQMLPQSAIVALPVVVSASGFVILTLAGFHFYVMVAETDLTLGRLLRNALLLAVVNLPAGFAALLAAATVWIVYVLLYPASVLMPAVCNFSFCILVAAFAARGAVRRHVIREGDRV